MSGVMLGLAEVETQLRSLRRRLNLYRLQGVLYPVAALMALVASVLISLALRSTPSLFGYTLWACLALVIIGAGAGVARLRRHWLSLEQAARIADRRARLEDRLSTLLAHRPAAGVSSRMTGMLLSQVADLRARWEPQAVAPVRVPRSLFAFLATLALLAASLILERPSLRGPASSRPTIKTVPAAGRASASGPGEPGHASSAGIGAPGKVPGQFAASGKAPVPATLHGRSRPVSRSDVAPQDAAAPAAQNVRPPAQAASEPAAGSLESGDPVSQRVQNLIRKAFGAERISAPRDLTSDAKHRRSRRTANSRNPEGRGRERKPGNGSGGKAQAKMAGTAESRPQGGQGKQAGPGGREASGSRAGGSAGTAPLARPGGEGRNGNAGSSPGTFTVKLTGASRILYTTMEPQRDGKGRRIPAFGSEPVADKEQSLGSQTSEEQPLHKVVIPAEHAATVRRIFTRDADE